jgi:hypothetical protein
MRGIPTMGGKGAVRDISYKIIAYASFAAAVLLIGFLIVT